MAEGEASLSLLCTSDCNKNEEANFEAIAFTNLIFEIFEEVL